MIECWGCHREDDRPVSSGLSSRQWYENGYSKRFNLELTEDILFAICPECRANKDPDIIQEAWRWANRCMASQKTGKK